MQKYRKPSLLYIALGLFVVVTMIAGLIALVLGGISQHRERQALAAAIEENNASNYTYGLNRLAEGDLLSAVNVFTHLDQYKDAQQLATLSAAAYLRGLDLSSTSVYGRHSVPFGRRDGGHIAKWVVLDIQDGKALLLHKGNRGSERSLDEFQFSPYEEARIADREPDIPMSLLENIPYDSSLRPAIWIDIT